MCPDRHWFVAYEKKFGGNVLIGNDVPCKSVGIGFVQIRMNDGVVITLTEFCYIPKLKKNLVFGGAMDSKGFLAGLNVEYVDQRKREVCGNVGNQARKFVYPSGVDCDKLCLCYFIIWKSCV